MNMRKRKMKLNLRSLRKLDYRIFLLVNGRLHAPVIDTPVRAVNRVDVALGDLGKVIIILFIAAIVLWLFERPFNEARFLLMTGVIVANALIAIIIKYLVKGKRPLYVFASRVRILSERRYVHSMPSGHTLIAFCLAVLLSTQFPALAWLFYSLAALVGIYRVYVGAHFPSDVLIGMLLGVGITKLLLGFWARGG